MSSADIANYPGILGYSPEIREQSRFLHEEMASLRATIPAIDRAEVLEAKRLPAVRNLCGRGNGYGNIDNRFCVETGHGSASHVLDIQHVASDELAQDASFLLESAWPARVVRGDLYGTLLEADPASSLEPGCEVTAEKSYRQPSDQPRDIIISVPGNVLLDPGLRRAGTLCV